MAKYRSTGETDVGLKREQNEDTFLVNDALGLYVVCDGMGGHRGGQAASRLAVQAIERELLSAQARPDNPFASDAPLAASPLSAALRAAVEGACAAVYRESQQNPELTGMGTTCISLLLRDQKAIVGHVGDSRAYLVRDGAVHQLSEDHSLVHEQVRAGLLSQDEARHSRLRNIITRSVGFEESVLVDVIGFETRPGDRFLLCSDGLANLVDNGEIRDHLLQHDTAQVPRKLIDLANDRGGDDNITVVAIVRTE